LKISICIVQPKFIVQYVENQFITILQLLYSISHARTHAKHTHTHVSKFFSKIVCCAYVKMFKFMVIVWIIKEKFYHIVGKFMNNM